MGRSVAHRIQKNKLVIDPVVGGPVALKKDNIPLSINRDFFTSEVSIGKPIKAVVGVVIIALIQVS